MAFEIPLLQPDDIEVKIKKVTAKGAVALLYKTARTDMNILDDVFGAENWTCDYTEVKGNLYCTIRVRFGDTWVGKQDCGIESREDGDGNEKKGEASDAFKRAGFRWGIGRELYTAPFTFLSVETVKDGNSYKLSKPFERFSVKTIGYDDSRRINRLVITGDNNRVVFSTQAPLPTKYDTPKGTPASEVDPRTKLVNDYCKAHKLSRKEFGEAITPYTSKPLADMTPEELKAAIETMAKDTPLK